MTIIAEALEIIRNARAAYERGEITAEQMREVIRQTTLYIGYQYELITEPIVPPYHLSD